MLSYRPALHNEYFLIAIHCAESGLIRGNAECLVSATELLVFPAVIFCVFTTPRSTSA